MDESRNIFPEEKFMRIKKAAIGFALSSTAHGIPKMFRTEFKLLRMMWFICFCFSTAACVLLCVKSILKYYEHGVVTKISQVVEYHTSFPAISICNMNGLTSETAVEFSKNLMANVNYSLNDPHYFILNKAKSASSKLNDEQLKSFGLPLESSIQYCSFNGEECNSSDFSWFFR